MIFFRTGNSLNWVPHFRSLNIITFEIYYMTMSASCISSTCFLFFLLTLSLSASEYSMYVPIMYTVCKGRKKKGYTKCHWIYIKYFFLFVRDFSLRKGWIYMTKYKIKITWKYSFYYQFEYIIFFLIHKFIHIYVYYIYDRLIFITNRERNDYISGYQLNLLKSQKVSKWKWMSWMY